jgi:histidinol phosphatase-like enzyme
MLDEIALKWHISKENMVFIGDRDSDIECANNFQIDSVKYNGLDNLLDLKDNIIKIIG